MHTTPGPEHSNANKSTKVMFGTLRRSDDQDLQSCCSFSDGTGMLAFWKSALTCHSAFSHMKASKLYAYAYVEVLILAQPEMLNADIV
eukprot:1156303-Pelagomonas_calceolata.AAC.3